MLKKLLKRTFSFKKFNQEDDVLNFDDNELLKEGNSQTDHFEKHHKGAIIDLEVFKKTKTLEEALVHYEQFHPVSFLDEKLKTVYWESFLRFVSKKLKKEETKMNPDVFQQSSDAVDGIRFFCRNQDSVYQHRSSSVPKILSTKDIQGFKKTLINNHFLDFFKAEYEQMFKFTITLSNLKGSGYAF